MAISGGDGSIILTTKVDQKGLKSGLKSMTSIVTKSFAVIGAAAATATAAITKMASSAYADYEQLVGGVETLFKNSANKVMQYANNAFYTAGISSNEYMKQVTSFSASLIRSTAGDTEKAADVANMAMIDMSDNANKMDSTMESITDTYQGFAKQQYQLLDNLKLGYGGTKGEMERLLKDAQSLTGVKYDINNLADVYSAIHAIQEEIGITGTTAKEAEKTISGSANMMKAAWQNVLVAISGGGDLDKAINNLVYSIQKYFENIVPVIQRSIAGIGRMIEKVAPMLVQNVASALIQSIPNLINAVYQMIIGLAKGIWQGIKALFSGNSGNIAAQIETSVGGIADSAGQASQGMEQLGDATEKAGKQANKSLAAFDDLNILAAGGSSPEEIAADIAPAIGGAGNMKSEMSVVAKDEGQITFLDEVLKKLQPIRDIFMSGFWEGFENADFSPIQTSIDGIGQSLQELFSSSELQKTVQKFSKRFIKSLGNISGSVASIGKTTAENLVGGINKYLQNNLPFLQTSISNIFDASSGISSAVGNTFNSFASIFSVLASENGVNLTSNIIGMFANAGIGITSLATTIGEDFINALSTPIIENESGIKTVLDGLLGNFALFSGSIKTIVDALFSDITQLYDLHISPLIQTMTEVWSGWVQTFVDSYNEYLKPVIDNFAEKFETMVNENIAPMIEKITGFVGKIYDVVDALWQNLLKPLGDWVVKAFVKQFSHSFSTISSVVITVVGTITSWIGNIATALSGLLDFIVGVFTGDWNKALTGIQTSFGGMIDAISLLWKGIINLFIDAINGFTSGINMVLDAVNKLPGVNIPSISQIPRLAQGTVVPPNREFLAVLGDNKKEPEVVSPISTMKQALKEAIAESGYNGQPTREEHYYLNETQLMSIVYKLVKGGERLNGNSLLGGTY